jgi:hypothetical protein
MQATSTTHESAELREVGQRVETCLVQDHREDSKGDRDGDQLELARGAQRQPQVDEREHRRDQ